jgi:hypothetical protein
MSEGRKVKDTTNYFRVVASGESFDVDGFTKLLPLQINEIWHRGEPRGGCADLNETSGLCIDLGIGVDLNIEEQQDIAVEYLSANQNALQVLRSFPGVTDFYLGLQGTVHSNSLGSIYDLSPHSMEIALKIGVRVTIWSCLIEPYPSGPDTG